MLNPGESISINLLATKGVSAMTLNVGNVRPDRANCRGPCADWVGSCRHHRSLGLYRSCPAAHGAHARMSGLFAAWRQYVLDKHERREITGPIGEATSAPVLRCPETQG